MEWKFGACNIVCVCVCVYVRGLPRWPSGKEPTCQCRRHERHGFDPWVGKIPWRRPWQPTPGFLPGESPWREKPGGLQFIGLQRVGHDWSDLTHMHPYMSFIRHVPTHRMSNTKSDYLKADSGWWLSVDVVSSIVTHRPPRWGKQCCVEGRRGLWKLSVLSTQFCGWTKNCSRKMKSIKRSPDRWDPLTLS